MDDSKIAVGVALKAQGVRGEIKVKPLTDDAARFAALKAVFIDGRRFSVSACSVRAGFVYLSLDGITDRDAAQALSGKEITIDRANAVRPGGDSYFITDILGCEVTTDKGRSLGKVIDIFRRGSTDVWFCEEGSFPFLKKLIKETDLANKRIVLFDEVAEEAVVYAE